MTKARERIRYELFSSTDYPISRETELWRYLTFEKFVSLLDKSALYHARLDCLGDPFEGSVTKPYARLRAAGAPVGYLYFPEHEGTNNVRLMLCSFVSCWHASSFESAAMWKLYSRDDAGVAIVSTPGHLVEAVDLGAYHDGMLGPVEYLDFETHDMKLPFGKTARPGFLKRKSFEHEKEVRAMVRFEKYPDNANDIFSPEWVKSLAEELPRGVNLSADLRQLIKRIHVSPSAAGWFLDLVKTASARVGMGDLVQRSDMLGEPVY